MQQHIDQMCEAHGWPKREVSTSFNPDACYCACPDGPCEHKFEGWHEFEYEGGGGGGTTVCNRCGATAMGHDMQVMP